MNSTYPSTQGVLEPGHTGSKEPITITLFPNSAFSDHEMGHDGSNHNREIKNHHKLDFGVLPESWLLNIYPHIHENITT